MAESTDKLINALKCTKYSTILQSHVIRRYILGRLQLVHALHHKAVYI